MYNNWGHDTGGGLKVMGTVRMSLPQNVPVIKIVSNSCEPLTFLITDVGLEYLPGKGVVTDAAVKTCAF